MERAIRQEGQASPSQKILKANIHSKLGEKEKAHKIWVELSERDPGDYNSAINASLTAPNLIQNESYIQRAVAASPQNEYCQYYLALTLIEKGDSSGSRRALEKARKYFEGMLEHHPENMSYLTHLAVTLDRLGDSADADLLWKRYHEFQRNQESASVDTSHAIALTPAIRIR